MPSNFADAGKRLQTAISVPELPTASIRNRLRSANARHRWNVLAACALVAVAGLASGTVIAAMNGGVRLWLSGDKAAIALRSFTVVQNPNADTLRRVVADATFPVVLPAGIPNGMHVYQLIFSPANHPNFIDIGYRNARTDARINQVLLFDSSTVAHGEAPPLPTGETLQSVHATPWTVGGETVMVIGTGPLAEMKAAMSSITPAESLAQTLPMLYRITILGYIDRLADLAEAIAPSDGQNVLVDRATMNHVARQAQAHKPLLIRKSIVIETFPSVEGKPDWEHMKRHETTEVAVSAGGVRALAAVLASGVCGSGGKGGSGFTCGMLINELSGRNYWIWTLPLNPSMPPAKYVVDSTTFRIVRRTELTTQRFGDFEKLRDGRFFSNGIGMKQADADFDSLADWNESQARIAWDSESFRHDSDTEAR